jgi:L-Ala-D/L-Glu epimerase
VKVEIHRHRARLRAAFESSRDSVSERELLVLTLEASDGFIGVGEAAPLPGYDGVGPDDVIAALEDCRAVLRKADNLPREDVLAACRQAAVLPQALAAVDLALWDQAGRRAEVPVWRLLGAQSAPAVAVNHTISASDRAGASREAAWARTAGFGCVKVKVGVGDDGGRLAAVRAAAGPEMAIRVDANGAWSFEEARAALNAFAPIGIELCEEPVHGVDEIARLASVTTTPLAVDESAAAPGALETRACDAVCLKIARCGGISGLLRDAQRARTAGYELYLASTLDGPLGLAAALHAAAAITLDRPSGLATMGLFEAPDDLLVPRAGCLEIPSGPGLGAGLGAWYRG